MNFVHLEKDITMKILFPLSILTSLVIATSCQKDYVCTCTKTIIEPAYTYNSVNYSGTTNSTITQESFEAKKESSAEANCAFNEYTITYSSPNEPQGQGVTTEVNACEVRQWN